MEAFLNEIMKGSPKAIQNYKKAQKIVLNFDVQYGSPLFIELVKEALAAREFGLTWKAIDSHIEGKLEGRIHDF